MSEKPLFERWCYHCGTKMAVKDDRVTRYEIGTGTPYVAGRITTHCPKAAQEGAFHGSRETFSWEDVKDVYTFIFDEWPPPKPPKPLKERGCLGTVVLTVVLALTWLVLLFLTIAAYDRRTLVLV